MPLFIKFKSASGPIKKKGGAPKADFARYEEEHLRRRGIGEALPMVQSEARELVKWADLNPGKLKGTKNLVAEVIARKLLNRFGHEKAPKRRKGKGTAARYSIALLEEYQEKKLSDECFKSLLAHLREDLP